MAITINSELYIWGTLMNEDGSRSLRIESPELVEGIAALSITAGPSMAYVVDSENRCLALGVNSNGELGLGDKEIR